MKLVGITASRRVPARQAIPVHGAQNEAEGLQLWWRRDQRAVIIDGVQERTLPKVHFTPLVLRQAHSRMVGSRTDVGVCNAQ